MKETPEPFNNPSKTNIRKWLTGIVLVILLAITAFAWYVNRQLKPILTERIKEIIINSSDSLYTIDFDDINVNLITGNVSIKNLVFKPDSLVYQQMKRKNIAPRHLYKVELTGLILNRVHPGKVYFRNQLNMQALIINNPRVQVFFEDVIEKEDTTKTKTIYQHLSKYLKSVNVGNIVLQDVDFKYIDRSILHPDTTGVKNVSVGIRDLLIDSASQYDRSRFYYTKDIYVQVKDYKYRTANKMYDISFDELSASTANRFINLKGLKMTPLYSDLTFSRRFAVQKDRYDLFFGEILFNNIDFKSLNRTRSLKTSNMLIRGAAVNVFLNRELPKPDLDKGRNFPHIALKRLRLNTIIDTIKIQDATIRYTEYNPKTSGRGTIFLNHIGGTLLNVTNDSSALVSNNWCKADLSAMLMGKGLLKVGMNFNLTDPNAKFNYSGSLGPINARDLNPVLRPLAMVEIKSGKIEKAIFSVSGNYRTSSGKLQLYYNNLKVGVLAIEEDGTKLKKQGLVSLIANALLITDNNPSPGEGLRVANTTFVRPPDASFFNMMWKSVFEGIKATIGFTAQRERELQRNFDKMKGLKGSKPERIERREERKEKREERRENNNQ